MADLSAEIDKLVREVMARLSSPALEAVSAAPQGPPGGDGEAPVPPAYAERNGQLVVGSRVVTLEELSGRLDGVKRLVVPAKAVVTPAVKDELQRRKIALVHDEAGAAPPGADKRRMILAAVGCDEAAATLLAALEQEPVEVAVARSECLMTAADRLAEELRQPNTLGVLLTGSPAVALCLANRHRGVRAVWGIDPGRIAADAGSVGANLLVLDVKTTGLFQQRQMVIRFCRRPAECPESLRERLG